LTERKLGVGVIGCGNIADGAHLVEAPNAGRYDRTLAHLVDSILADEPPSPVGAPALAAV